MTYSELSLHLTALALLATTIHLSIPVIMAALLWLLIRSAHDDPSP